MLAAADDLRKYLYGAYVALCLQTGIRTEEARALTWDHVDLDGNPDSDPPVPPSIAVWRSVREHGDTKTRLSRRTLALPQSTADALRAAPRTAGRRPDTAGDGWQDRGLVFCTRLGTPLSAGNIRRQVKSITTAAGLGTEWTPQELHSFVSLLGYGHSDRGDGQPDRALKHRTTEVIYGRELRPVLTRGAEAMDTMFS